MKKKGKEGEIGQETEQCVGYSQNVIPAPAASVLPRNLL